MRCKLAALMDAHNLQVSQAGHGKRMSQRTLAQETGLPLTSINRYFNDAVQRFDKDIVECLCHALNCGIEDFFILSEPKTTSRSDTLMEAAIAAWADYCEEHNYIYQQPCQNLSYVNSRNVVLKNVRGDLARYSIRQQRIV